MHRIDAYRMISAAQPLWVSRGAQLPYVSGHRHHSLPGRWRHPRKCPAHGGVGEARTPPRSTTAPMTRSRSTRSSRIRMERTETGHPATRRGYMVYPASLCWLRSSPICSSSSETAQPQSRVEPLEEEEGHDRWNTHVATMAMILMPRVPTSPNSSHPPSGIDGFGGKDPVASAPQVPPTPWTPTTSRESSYPSGVSSPPRTRTQDAGDAPNKEGGKRAHKARPWGDGPQPGNRAAGGAQHWSVARLRTQQTPRSAWPSPQRYSSLQRRLRQCRPRPRHSLS